MNIPLKYNFRSLLVRRMSTALITLSIALVVSIFVGRHGPWPAAWKTVLVSTGDSPQRPGPPTGLRLGAQQFLHAGMLRQFAPRICPASAAGPR